MNSFSKFVRERFNYLKNENKSKNFSQIYEATLYERLNLKENHPLKIYTYLEIAVYFCDLYVMLTHKKKENLLTQEDYADFMVIDLITSFEELEEEMMMIPSFLEDCMEKSNEFYQLSFFGKANVFRHLSEEDHTFLSTINPFYLEEKEFYQREITEKDYLYHYETEMHKIQTNEQTAGVVSEHVIEEMIGFLKHLASENYENYMNNVKTFLIYHYEWSKYFVTHKEMMDPTEKETFESAVEIFETYSIPELAEELLYNDNYLFQIVDFYIATYPVASKYSYSGKKITYEEVKDYVEKNIDEDTLEKVKYKKTRI